jgi:phage terminase large subunit-like protein
MRQQSRPQGQKTGTKAPGSVIRGLKRSDCAHLPKLVLENIETGDEEEIPDYPAIGKLYAEVVASGRLPTNRLMVAATARYLRMLEMAEDPTNDFVFSPLHVVDYCKFGETLKHFEPGSWQFNQIDEYGNPDPRIILEPFEIWMECAIQGFRSRITGERLVSTALEVVPRKNAKSLRASRAILFDLCCGGDAAEIPIAASTIEQVEKTVFGDVLKMVNNDPDLVDQFKLEVTKKEIRRGSGKVFILSSQGENQDGLNPSLAIFEEGHAGAMSVYRVIDSAFGARPNALKRMITTAGYHLEGPAYELIAEARTILEGRFEDYTFFAAIYTLDAEDYLNKETKIIDYDRLFTDRSLLYKANPMMEISLDPVKIKALLDAAIRTPTKRLEQARTRFNIWAGSGKSLLEPEAWAACRRDVQLEDYFGRKCWIGVDLAQVKDMCAIVLLFEEPGGEITVFPKFYLPELSPTAVNPEIIDNISNWSDEGLLTLVPGPLADHDLVREDCEAFCDLFDVQVIACDPAQSHNVVKRLWDIDKPVMTYPNSDKTMTPPFDDIDGRIASQRIWHDGNPVLAWNVANVHGDRKGNGLVLPRKEKPDSIRKIDGFVALCFANGVRINPAIGKDTAEEPKDNNAYLNRGIIGYEEMIGELNG